MLDATVLATPLQQQLNDLTLGLFLLTGFGMTVARQVQATLVAFIAQALLLAASSLLLGLHPISRHLLALTAVTLISKPILIPILLRRLVPGEVYTKRELTQPINITTSLLIALALAVAAYFFSLPLVRAGIPLLSSGNVAIGIAGLLVGLYQVVARNEAVPQLLGILAMENSAFLAGVAIAPDFPLIAELVIAFDVPLLVLIVGLLTRALHERIGSTDTATLVALREQGLP
jgi:hydrogenase-4 membrane subunit HyfE